MPALYQHWRFHCCTNVGLVTGGQQWAFQHWNISGLSSSSRSSSFACGSFVSSHFPDDSHRAINSSFIYSIYRIALWNSFRSNYIFWQSIPNIHCHVSEKISSELVEFATLIVPHPLKTVGLLFAMSWFNFVLSICIVNWSIDHLIV